MNAVEVVVDNARSAGLFFPPLQRTLRGRFNMRDVREPEAMRLTLQWPETIPGQVIGLEADGTGYIRDPLHEPGQAKNRERIAASGKALPPEREEFADADKPTWLFWLKRSVEAGHAKVIAGSLPERIEGKPRKQFVSPERTDPRDGLIRRLVGIVFAALPEGKRREVNELLAEAEPDA